VDRHVGAKEVAIEYQPFTGLASNAIKKPVPQARREQLAVSDEVLTKIIDVARHVERIFGVPQDIELVVDEAGEITVVQARSITRLPDKFIPFNSPSV